MSLPKNWRRLPTHELEAKLADAELSPGLLSDDEVDDLIEEVTERDAQAAANRGEMNGIAPTVDIIDQLDNDVPPSYGL